MDRRRGKRFANYRVEEVEHFLRNNPEKVDTKIGFELLVGCVLARCNEKIKGELPNVGYMVKGIFSDSDKLLRPNMHELFGGNIIEDRDVDVWLQNSYGQSPIQITRLERHGAKDNANKGLLRLIEKKIMVQSDKYLQLVIFIDYNFDMDKKIMDNLFKGKFIPYKRVYLVGQMGTRPQLGEFRCWEVYPENKYSDIKINLVCTKQ